MTIEQKMFFGFTDNRVRLTDNLGFFFSCFKEDDAVRFCINNIRSFYPDSPIYLASDGGSDFSDLERQYENLKFRLYEDKLGYVNHPETKDKEKLIECCEEFLERIKAATEYSNKEYMIYYEPDVFLRGQIRVESDLHINGSYANTMDHTVLEYIDRKNPQNSNLNFGACGGSIMRASSLIDVISRTDRSLLRDLVYLDPRISNCDFLLTVLFNVHGYRYHVNSDFIEARRDQQWTTTGHSIVHQFHHNYQGNYDGKYSKSK